MFLNLCNHGAGGESRTPVSALGRPYNGRYTTPAFFLEPPVGIEPTTYTLRMCRSAN